jgi:hypothetical protein
MSNVISLAAVRQARQAPAPPAPKPTYKDALAAQQAAQLMPDPLRWRKSSSRDEYEAWLYCNPVPKGIIGLSVFKTPGSDWRGKVTTLPGGKVWVKDMPPGIGSNVAKACAWVEEQWLKSADFPRAGIEVASAPPLHWRESQAGNLWTKDPEGRHFVIFQNRHVWGGRVTLPSGEAWFENMPSVSSAEEARDWAEESLRSHCVPNAAVPAQGERTGP